MFALVDCNNFFASCEMVFNPKLEEKPLVILSNNDGIIIARSPRAKALGVQMGDPVYLYKERKDLVLLSANFFLYSDMSQRVMQTLSTFSSEIEIYSIDEAFLLVEETGILKQIRERVRQWTGIPVSIGAAPTKTLAKLASDRAKKEGGVFVLEGDGIERLLAHTELEEIWGIGGALAERLKRERIYTALQLCQVDDTLLRKWLGVTGFRTVLELRGTPCFEMCETPEKKKSIVCSRSFGQKVTDLAQLQEAAAAFAASAAEKLREQESLAGFISVFVVTAQETGSCHVQIPNATSFTPELIALAKEGVKKIFRQGLEYRKAGVLLGDFTEDRQEDFITPRGKDRGKVMKVVDEINARYDKPMVRFAAEGIDRPWKSRRSQTSPKYTTNWTDLLKV